MAKSGLTEKRVAKMRKQAIAETSKRAHAALVATIGTSRAPSVEKCAEAIGNCMEWAHHEDYLDTDYFHWDTMLIHVERGKGLLLGDRFTIYVPATGGHFWAQEDMGRKSQQKVPKTGEGRE